ncbi:RAD51-associated protein 1 [Spea bombifrons]|uniref:RAD51-associated protein 1 n=1 Tax=Spea bombifrons TaxID=233779 RepID=UPI00234BA326|nr:RAD51-associated protein 1 [Spea bombifrons]XP_053318616.1 RAD51-associated protein 1 [Spea bombifrons]
MDRPVRVKKAVDYSQFGDLDNDDEDFACSSAPPTKKARVEIKKDKKEKPVKKPQKEDSSSQEASQGKRLPLDEKLYKRDLDVALALSVQNTTAIVESSGDQLDKGSPPPFTDTKDADTSFSNCSVDGSALGLDEISDNPEDQVKGRSRRQAASKAITEQRKLLADDSEEEETEEEFKPEVAAYESSESNSSLSEEDEEFDLKKTSKLKPSKGNKQKGAKKTDKKEKIVSKPKAPGRSAVPSVPIKSKPPPAQRALVSSPAPVKPTLHQSPPVGMKKQKWTPPATVNNVKSSLGGAAVRSPTQGLRLGLSRFARVKPLHTTFVND